MENNTLLKAFVQEIKERVRLEAGIKDTIYGLDHFLPEELEPFVKEVLKCLKHPDIATTCSLGFDRIMIQLRWRGQGRRKHYWEE